MYTTQPYSSTVKVLASAALDKSVPGAGAQLARELAGVAAEQGKGLEVYTPFQTKLWTDLGFKGNEAITEGVPVPGVVGETAGTHKFGGVVLNDNQIAVFVVAALAAILLWFVIRRTRVGLEMRAVVDRESLADRAQRIAAFLVLESREEILRSFQ